MVHLSMLTDDLFQECSEC